MLEKIKLYKFAYIENMKKVFIVELEAQEHEIDYFISPITCVYKTELNKVQDDGIMYSLKNDIDAYIQARIKREKEKQEKMREEYEKAIKESTNIIDALNCFDVEKDVTLFQTTEKSKIRFV